MACSISNLFSIVSSFQKSFRRFEGKENNINCVFCFSPTKTQFSTSFVNSRLLTHCRLWVKQTKAHPFLLPPLSEKCTRTKVSQDSTAVWMLMSWELSRWMQPKWVSMMSQRDTLLIVPDGPAKILEPRFARVSWPDSSWHAPWPHLIEWEQSSWVNLRIRKFTVVCLTVLWRLFNKRDLWVSGVDLFQCKYRWYHGLQHRTDSKTFVDSYKFLVYHFLYLQLGAFRTNGHSAVVDNWIPLCQLWFQESLRPSPTQSTKRLYAYQSILGWSRWRFV